MGQQCESKSLVQAAGAILTDRFPQTEEEADQVDAILAKELERLSFQEREEILYDIHGVSGVQPEDPLVVEQKLGELENELNTMMLLHEGCMKTGCEAYKLALAMNKEYVCSRSFRLMFLRKEKFDVKRAAGLIVRHFDMKRKLFGDGEILARSVCQSDFNEMEMQHLQSGFVRFWPGRDSAGRAVLSFESPRVSDVPPDYHSIHYRGLWYVAMKALNDEITQRLGAVWVISHLHNDAIVVSVDEIKDMHATNDALPLAVVAKHFCHKHAENRPFLAGVHVLSNEQLRPRSRVHYGPSREALQSVLQTFGIPKQWFPTELNTTRILAEHQRWLWEQRIQEGQLKMEPNGRNIATVSMDHDTFLPRPFDVLFGRSAFARGYTGTLRAMHIVEMNFASYEKLGRYQKMDMAEKIVKEIQESGGRFLRQEDDGEWSVVHDDEARKKVAHWFRGRRRMNRLLKPEQVGGNSPSSDGSGTKRALIDQSQE